MTTGASTQENVPIAGIKDGIIILKTGQYRIVLDVAAINFSLKSEEEQNSLVMQYQGFINSLHFPIQIVVRSSKLDLSPYINNIKKIATEQKNDLIRMQTEDYADFVGQLINLANIMKKQFFVIVGYDPLTLSQGSFLDKILKRDQYVGKLKISEDDFEHHAKELRSRAQTIAGGLGGLGLHCQQVGTKELIELFYGLYNPEIAGKERLNDTGDVGSSYVTQLKPKDKEAEDLPKAVKEESPTIDNKAIVQETAKQAQAATAIKDDEAAEKTVETTEVSNTATKDIPASEVKPALPQTVEPSGQATIPAKPADDNERLAKEMVNTVTPAPTAIANQPSAGATQIEKAETAEVADPTLNKDYGW